MAVAIAGTLAVFPASACAQVFTVTASGAWGPAAPITTWTAPNSTWQVSVQISLAPVSPVGSCSGVPFGPPNSTAFDVYFTNFTYSLGGTVVNTLNGCPSYVAYYASSGGGGLILDDFGGLNNGFILAMGTQLFSGSTLNPTLLTGTFPAQNSVFGFPDGSQVYVSSGTLSISGGGGPSVTLSASALNFGDEVGSTNPTETINSTLQVSQTQTLTLTNSGSAALTASSIDVSGANDFQYQEADNDCVSQGSIAVGTSCPITVAFSPSTIGPETATLQINDNASDSPQTVDLTGAGTTGFYQNAGPPCPPIANPPPCAAPPYDSAAPQSFDNGMVNTAQAGCALASSASMLSALGLNATPISLDMFLSNYLGPNGVGGYENQGDLNFSAISAYAQSLGVQLVRAEDLSTPGQATAVAYLQSLPPSYQVILQMCVPASATTCDTGFPSHYVLALGPIPSNNDWGVFDPGWTNSTTVGQVNDWTISGHAAGFTCPGCLKNQNKQFIVRSVRPFVFTGDVSGLEVTAESPVELLLADPQGRQLGNLGPGNDVFEPPESSYFRDYPIADDEGDQPPLGETDGIKTAYIPSAVAGTYVLNAVGTGSGSYTLVFTATATDGSVQQTTMSGMTSTGSTASYQATYSSVPGSPLTVTPMSSIVSLSATTLTFASQLVGTGSGVQNVTLSNTGGASINITGIIVTGGNNADFAQVNTCGASLGVGAACTISVMFTPTATGGRTAVLTITDSAIASPQSITLSGTGVAPTASVSTGSLSFGSQIVGTTSAAQTVTLSNTGTAALTITGVTTSGGFAETNNCGSSVAAGSSCSISVTFTPASTGTLSGTLTITDNNNGVANSTQTVSLSGVGLAPVAGLSTGSLTFASQVVGTTSAAQTVTLSNTGTAALAITSVTASGGFAETNNCGSSLAASSSCTISITFTPVATGTVSGALTVTDNSHGVTGSTQSVSLSGVGLAPFTITPTPSTETIQRGVVGAFILTLQSLDSFKGNVTLGCSGGPSGSYCVDFPMTVYLNGTAYAISGILFPKNSAPGTYIITFTGTSGSLSTEATATFIVK